MTAAGRPARDGLNIGAVLARLRPEFPDVTISKIRFLETEGLLAPGRSASGYRQFAAADVERLRYILAAQRDRYLPLKVIKEQLDAFERGGELPDDAPGTPRPPRSLVSVDGLPGPEAFADTPPPPRLTREQLCERAGLDETMLAELEQYGLVRAGAAGFFDDDAVLVARTAQELTVFGIEPRHLRAFRASADREVGLLEQIVAPIYRQRSANAGERGDEAAMQLAALSVRLHTLLVKIGLRGVTGR